MKRFLGLLLVIISLIFLSIPVAAAETVWYNGTNAASLSGAEPVIPDVYKVFPELVTDKVFTEWNTAADGSGKAYRMGDPCEEDAFPEALYAQWTDAVSVESLADLQQKIAAAPTDGTAAAFRLPAVLQDEDLEISLTSGQRVILVGAPEGTRISGLPVFTLNKASLQLSGVSFERAADLLESPVFSPDNGAELRLSGVEVRNANADGVSAVIYSDSGSLVSVLDCVFSGNRTNQNGGVIMVTGNSDLILDGAVFSDNHADDGFGGCIYSDFGNISIYAAEFRNNSANGGGAIGTIGAETQLLLEQNTAFINNHAEILGGAIFHCPTGHTAFNEEYGSLYWLWFSRNTADMAGDDYYSSAKSNLTSTYIHDTTYQNAPLNWYKDEKDARDSGPAPRSYYWDSGSLVALKNHADSTLETAAAAAAKIIFADNTALTTDGGAIFNNGLFSDTYPLTSVTVHKKWINEEDANSGKTATLRLYADGEATDKTIVLDGVADDSGEFVSWSARFDKLPYYRFISESYTYQPVEYTVKEESTDPTFRAKYTMGSSARDGETISNVRRQLFAASQPTPTAQETTATPLTPTAQETTATVTSTASRETPETTATVSVTPETGRTPAARITPERGVTPETPERPHVPDHLPDTGFNVLYPREIAASLVSYDFSGLELQIPQLEVAEAIVLVPADADGYDVSGIGKTAGLLADSALPGQGLSILTGHNHLNALESGPFVNLYSLEPGARIMITDAEGQLQLFSVYDNLKIAADDGALLLEAASAEPDTLVLLTCEDESMEGGYLNRRVILARKAGS